MTLAAEYDAIPTATKRIQANEHGAGIVGENGSVCTIVDTATFDHERDQAVLQENVPSVFGMTRWAAKAKCEIEFHAKYERLDMPSAVY